MIPALRHLQRLWLALPRHPVDQPVLAVEAPAPAIKRRAATYMMVPALHYPRRLLLPPLDRPVDLDSASWTKCRKPLALWSGRRNLPNVDELAAGGYIRSMEKHPSLGIETEAALDGLVQTGRYSTREDVLREGVRLLQDREARLALIDAAVARGIEDAETGRSEDAEIVLGRLRRKYEAAAAKPAA